MQIRIKIDKGFFWLSNDISFPFSKTNIPEGAIQFRQPKIIYWLVEILNYDGHQNKLRVRVLDYDLVDFKAFLEQKPKKKIDFLEFDKLDWNQLESLLASYHKIKLKPLIKETSQGEFKNKNFESKNDTYVSFKDTEF